MPPAPEYRAHFDFDIRFANGGGLSGTGFRLDLPSAELTQDEIARLLIVHLGLALVDEVELRGLRVVEEAHRGSRGVETADGCRSPRPRRLGSWISATRSGPVS